MRMLFFLLIAREEREMNLEKRSVYYHRYEGYKSKQDE
jgi:hypothetical protein